VRIRWYYYQPLGNPKTQKVYKPIWETLGLAETTCRYGRAATNRRHIDTYKASSATGPP
jgi:hypothetical protein